MTATAQQERYEAQSPNVAGYTRRHMYGLMRRGEARQDFTPSTINEGAARSRLYNAASRLGVEISTHAITQAHDYGTVIAMTVKPAGYDEVLPLVDGQAFGRRPFDLLFDITTGVFEPLGVVLDVHQRDTLAGLIWDLWQTDKPATIHEVTMAICEFYQEVAAE